MRDVDLNRFPFDFDLTFSVLVMAPDGTVHHRFGGRDHEDPTRWVAMKPLIRVLERGLEAHESYRQTPPAAPPPRRTIADYSAYATFKQGKGSECIHCHQIGEMEVRSAQAAGGFDKGSVWRYPSPEKTGLVMDPEAQDKVTEVRAGSAAARAGLAAGDRILRLGQTAIASVSDMQAALHAAPSGETRLPLRFARDGATRSTTLSLEAGWKVGDSLSFSWRPLKWPMAPAPGFGGADLGTEQKRRLGLDPDGYAFKIDYLVTWGPRAHLGRNAAKAGLRKDDVVFAINGKSDFRHQDHFHAWFRLQLRAGQHVEVRYLRGGKRRVARFKAMD